MKAKEFLDAGQLSAVVSELNEEVKRDPSDGRLRTFLFEALCFAGEYERAERQLEAIGHQNESASIGVEVYRHLLRAETARQRCFSAGLRPTFLLEPPPYIHLHLEALNRVREKNFDEAGVLLAKSEQARHPRKGRAGGRPFASFRDSDDLLAPILEVFARDAYVWLPLEHIRKATIAAPKYLRDLMWVRATIESVGGSIGEVFLPVLYEGSHNEKDDRLRLGRMTDWKALGNGLARGVGQRTFLVDDEERGILEVHELDFEIDESDGKVV
jgi:type VI secretion system protein ImpE